jgi:hypothetical protein
MLENYNNNKYIAKVVAMREKYMIRAKKCSELNVIILEQAKDLKYLGRRIFCAEVNKYLKGNIIKLTGH